MKRNPEVDILSVHLEYDLDANRYVGEKDNWLLVVQQREGEWSGMIHFLDVIIWHGTYPTLKITVSRMETFLSQLAIHIRAFNL